MTPDWEVPYEVKSMLEHGSYKLEILKENEVSRTWYAMKLDLLTTNNEEEYEALIAGLGLAGALKVKNLKVCGDSRLVISKVNVGFETKVQKPIYYVSKK